LSLQQANAMGKRPQQHFVAAVLAPHVCSTRMIIRMLS